MKARRTRSALLVSLLAVSAWACAFQPPAYRTPLLVTLHDTQAPILDCTAAAIRGDNFGSVPLTLVASACTAWTEESCEIWAPQSGPAVVWSVVSALMSPTMILGHEAMHCWLHEYHGLLPWF